MATHSSVLAWRMLGMGQSGGLAFMGSHRVGHDWGDLAAAAAAGSHSEYQVKNSLILGHREKNESTLKYCRAFCIS